MKRALVWGFLASVVGCGHSGGGTETDNPASPLKDFSSSGCKNRAPASGQQPLVLSSDADGLQCVEWEQTGSGALTLRLLNFPEPCGNAYLGSAAVASDGVLEITAYKDTCAVFKCGLCIFDFSYQLVGSWSNEPLRVRLGSAVCESEPSTFADELTLPTSGKPSGIMCRYLERSALDWYAREGDRCGQRNMPCGVCDSATDKTTCTDGLTCTEVATGDSRCLESCAKKEDCADGLSNCVDGVCAADAAF